MNLKRAPRLRASCLAGLLSVGLSGCASLDMTEKAAFQELEPRLADVGLRPFQEKDPTSAALLNILPGIGNVYLEQWGVFVFNLLLWPVSITWGIPQAALDAEAINQQVTLDYYLDGYGKQELEALEKAITTEESIPESEDLIPLP